MDKPNNLYEVSSGSRKLHIYAASGEQAKRIFCKKYGLRANDNLYGVRALSARKLKKKEAEEWKNSVPDLRATANFISGMMTVCAKVHAAHDAAGKDESNESSQATGTL